MRYLPKRFRLFFSDVIERYRNQRARKRSGPLWRALRRFRDRGAWKTTVEKNNSGPIYVLKMTAMAVTVPAIFLLAAYFFIKWDISCSRRNADGPKIANTISISGCL
ncbi:hypothetical protein SAMN05444159_0379 [Bradyrhizobium lablabi]|uniref:Uncharacterized protein n=1 Tax=Bradyrhizobium lablabi TaxID=722472 RepID=A0A1M6IJH5_9BRAD|nr:hypothetical protein SAMN05444159_0379 [Bradyrhizobium lablabi]